jgi:hypothetical protein
MDKPRRCVAAIATWVRIAERKGQSELIDLGLLIRLQCGMQPRCGKTGSPRKTAIQPIGGILL